MASEMLWLLYLLCEQSQRLLMHRCVLYAHKYQYLTMGVTVHHTKLQWMPNSAIQYYWLHTREEMH